MSKIVDILTPWTSPAKVGVAIRYGVVVITAMLSAFGLVPQETIDWLRATAEEPELAGAVAAALGGVVVLYAILTKSRSPAADAVGKAVDGKDPVVVITPAGQPDAVISATTPIVTAEGKQLN